MLDEEQQRLLVGLPPGQFDDDRGDWGGVLAQAYGYLATRPARGLTPIPARIAFEAQLRDTPDDAQLRMLYGLTLAYLGRKADAIREGSTAWRAAPQRGRVQRGLQSAPAGADLHPGRGAREGIDQLESLLRIPYYLSPGWLRIDPSSIRCASIPGSRSCSGALRDRVA